MQGTERQEGALKSGTGILTGSASSAGKLAIVRQVLSDACRALAQSLSPAAEAKLELDLKSVDLGQAGDVLSTHSESIVSAAIRTDPWEMSLLAGVDRDFIHTLTDVLFGGGGGDAPFRPDRNLTRIEAEIVKVVFRRVSLALQECFAQAGPVTFSLERTDSPPSYDCIGRPSTIIAVGTLDLRSVAGTGRMFIALPQSAFVFLRPAPVRKTASPAMPVDPQWQQLLGNRLYGADVTVTAVLGSRQMTLGEVADFRPGQIIEIESVTDHRVSLDCNGQPLYWCKLAQANGVYSLNVEDAINREQEFMDDILSH